MTLYTQALQQPVKAKNWTGFFDTERHLRFSTALLRSKEYNRSTKVVARPRNQEIMPLSQWLKGILLGPASPSELSPGSAAETADCEVQRDLRPMDPSVLMRVQGLQVWATAGVPQAGLANPSNSRATASAPGSLEPIRLSADR